MMSKYIEKIVSNMDEQEKAHYADEFSKLLSPVAKRIQTAINSLAERTDSHKIGKKLKLAEACLSQSRIGPNNLFHCLTEEKAIALILISKIRLYYEHVDEHKSSISAYKAIKISQQHELPTPKWAKDVIVNCSSRICTLMDEDFTDSKLKKAVQIDGNAIKRFNGYLKSIEYEREIHKMTNNTSNTYKTIDSALGKLSETKHRDHKTIEKDYYKILAVLKENSAPPPLKE